MSLKDLFDKVTVQKSLTRKSAKDIGEEVESVDYHEADIINEKRFIPSVNYADASTFVHYGSAKRYYSDGIQNIYNDYPYDGSLYERLDWENSASYVDLYIFNDRYPRTNGYIKTSVSGWGDRDGAITPDGYGLPVSSDFEYISLWGGPNTGSSSPQERASNVWAPGNNRASNLALNLLSGSTVEFWMKKENFDSNNTDREVIFDLWNQTAATSAQYGRLRIELDRTADGTSPFLVTILSGATDLADWGEYAVGFQTASLGSSLTIANNSWHHYAISFKSASVGVQTKLYVDGVLNQEKIFDASGSSTDPLPVGIPSRRGVGNISGSMAAYVGALRTSPSGSSAAQYAGKLSASLDEFRYWKTERTGEDIGRYWFTQVGGGTNTDPSNTNLGVYYKFNEGISLTSSIDRIVLDYSGRVTNGTWVGYSATARSTGSAIVESTASFKEFKDPIVYSFHPSVQSLQKELEESGSYYDYNNNASLYHMFPSWMQDEDSQEGYELDQLSQIIGSYFDELHLQIQHSNTIKDYEYVSGSDKPNVFSERLLATRGLLAPELFLDADVLEKLADRSENMLFSSSLNDTKNVIYQNIYNNLINIYKSKGTEKSFRNLIRCFGVDEELIKLNLYGNNIEYELRDNKTTSDVRKRLIDFSNGDRSYGTVFQNTSSANSNTVGFITGSTDLQDGYAFTMETEVYFPMLVSPATKQFSSSVEIISSSLFGMHSVHPATAGGHSDASTAWGPSDPFNFQVYSVKDELGSGDARFLIKSLGPGGTGGGFVPDMTSSLYSDVYNNSRWTLAVRSKPSKYPLVSEVSGANFTSGTLNQYYDIELYGVQTEAGIVLNEFLVSSSVEMGSDQSIGFLTSSRRAYIGAHTTNFTGSTLSTSDVKVAGSRYWVDYLGTSTITAHAFDVKNYGAQYPYKNAYLFQNSLENNFEVPQIDTLALNWDFEQVSGSDSSGEFIVADFSSGSTTLTDNFSYLGPIVNAQHSGRGYNFPVNDSRSVDIDYLITARQNLPENLYADDMISILDTADDLQFTRESRPINFFFAFEKSMYRTISEEMLNMFGTIVEFNNLIGEPVNKYRAQYKRLGKLRELFFARVENTPNLDKYIEFYKWFDSSMSAIIQQLIPASSDFSKDVRVMVENHILARDKYQHKFPTLEMKSTEPIGSIQTNQSPFPASSPRPGWKFTHSPVGTELNEQSHNAPFWKQLAQRNSGSLYVTSSDNVVNADRSAILSSTRATLDRRKSTPYRLSFTAPQTTMNNRSANKFVYGGVNYAYNKTRDIVYEACAPAGPLVPGTNLPANVMLAFEKDVEKKQDIQDVLEPSLKKRLNFGINSSINKSGSYNEGAGNLTAPFSVYSSSVSTGYNAAVQAGYSGTIAINNLHDDVYGTHYEVPMQGPFTEKFVGGRQHRHIPINQYRADNLGTNNLDSAEDRGEGFKILIDGSHWVPGSPTTGALGIVGPLYPDPFSPIASPPYLYDRVKATYLRGEGAKRPVNIRNIRMDSSSIREYHEGDRHYPIGNYRKNYQVVQGASRTLNDIYFRRVASLQSPEFLPASFQFSTASEIPFIRHGSPNQKGQMGWRYPLTVVTDPVVDTLSFSGSHHDTQAPSIDVAFNANMDRGGESNSPAFGSGMSWSFWVWLDGGPGGGNHYMIVSQGSQQSVGPIRVFKLNDAGYFAMGLTTRKSGSRTVREWRGNTQISPDHFGSWVHLAVTLDSLTTTAAGWDVKYYINGTEDSWGVDGAAGANSTDWLCPLWSGSTGGQMYGDATSIAANGGFEPVTGQYSEGFGGYIDEVSYYSASLSDDDITDIYNSGCPADLTTLDSNSSLVSWWRMGERYDSGKFYDAKGINTGVANAYLDADDIREFVPGGCLTPVPMLNFELPDRSDNTEIVSTNNTIIVNQFSAPGGYSIDSLGYTIQPSEEKSVYNALPWRNLGVRGSGSLPSASIGTRDHLDKPRGLRSLLTLHSDQFGADATYGTAWWYGRQPGGVPIAPFGQGGVAGGPQSGYVPGISASYHKIQRNTKRRIELLGTSSLGNWFTASLADWYRTGSVYDNAFVTHPIPRSARQYAWISASAPGLEVYSTPSSSLSASLLNYTALSGGFVDSLPLITGSDFPTYYGETYTNNFVGMAGRLVVDSVLQSDNLLYANPVSPTITTRDPNDAVIDAGTYSGKFNGHGYVNIGTAATWKALVGSTATNAREVSFSVWFYTSKDNAGVSVQTCVSLGENSGGMDRGLRIHTNNKLLFVVGGNESDGTISSINALEPNRWYHAVATYDGSDPEGSSTDTAAGMKLYLDGVSQGVVASSLNEPSTINTSDCSIGAAFTDQWFFQGYIADVAVWNDELSSANATTLYNAGRPLDINTYLSTNLEAWYRFNPWTRKDPSGLSNVGDTHSTIINQIGTADTTGTPSNVKLSRFSPNSVDGLNILLNNRHGPYGYPSWKQIRTGDHKIARNQRENNILTIRNVGIYPDQQGVTPNGDTFTAFIEPPIDTDSDPITHTIVSNNKVIDNDGNEKTELQSLVYESSFGNKIGYFSRVELDNKLNLKKETDRGDLYFNRLNSILMKESTQQGASNQSPFESLENVYVNYRQKVYPAGYNTFLQRNRVRENYATGSIWSDNDLDRRFLSVFLSSSTVEGSGKAVWQGKSRTPTSSFGYPIISQSVWPLDGRLNLAATLASSSVDGTGELLNSYTWYVNTGQGDIYPGPVYSMRVPAGQNAGDFTQPVYAGGTMWEAGNPGPYSPGEATGSGKNPYPDYDEYIHNLRLTGKDYSIVPEFRISEFMDDYLNKYNEDYLTEIDGIFTLTGSTIPSSADERFFKVYSNSDFMKLFSVVDETYNKKLLIDNKIMKPSSLALRCNARLKFLPYKGFYPAERTLEISRLLSASYGDELVLQAGANATTATTIGVQPLSARAFYAPLISPGILYNSIKSGIAVSNFVVRNSASIGSVPGAPGVPHGIPDRDIAFPQAADASGVGTYNLTALGQGKVGTGGGAANQDPVAFTDFANTNGAYYYGTSSLLKLSHYDPATTGYADSTNGYYYDSVPFEALQAPEEYLNTRQVTGQKVLRYIYDNGIGSASLLNHYGVGTGKKYAYARFGWDGNGKKNYRYAIDNFLCETVDFFTPGVNSYISRREDQFKPVQSGSVYGLRVRLFRTLQKTFSSEARMGINDYSYCDPQRFLMYNRASSFSQPYAVKTGDSSNPDYWRPTWVHTTPAYFYGIGETILTWEAKYDGQPSLNEILSRTEFSSSRTGEESQYGKFGTTSTGQGQYSTIAFATQTVTSSVNVTNFVQDVIPGTATPSARWLINSKWETPVLNFTGTTNPVYPPEGTDKDSVGVDPNIGAARGTLDLNPATMGMWHQYGFLPTGSDEGVFMVIDVPQIAAHSTGLRTQIQSLADVVGMELGGVKRIGRVRDVQRLEEAVVAVPFTVAADGRRKFYRLPKRQVNAAIRVANGLSTTVERAAETQRLVNLMKKYVFPPRFDFVTNHQSVNPFAMYVFEFNAQLTQKDVSDIWQNLPPTIAEDLQPQVATIQHPILAEQFFDNDKRKMTSDLRWMVFKVKKRAKMNYDRLIKGQFTSDINTIPKNVDSKYSYNWPYDYFSLVELVKMETGIQYASEEPAASLLTGLTTADAGTTTAGGTPADGEIPIIPLDLG